MYRRDRRTTYAAMPVFDDVRNMHMAIVASMSVRAPNPLASPKPIYG
jgi:hypothetical protein